MIVESPTYYRSLVPNWKVPKPARMFWTSCVDDGAAVNVPEHSGCFYIRGWRLEALHRSAVRGAKYTFKSVVDVWSHAFRTFGHICGKVGVKEGLLIRLLMF